MFIDLVIRHPASSRQDRYSCSIAVTLETFLPIGQSISRSIEPVGANWYKLVAILCFDSFSTCFVLMNDEPIKPAEKLKFKNYLCKFATWVQSTIAVYGVAAGAPCGASVPKLRRRRRPALHLIYIPV